jgi:hypothetical protein
MVLILFIVSLYNLETIDIRDSGLKMLPPSIGCLQGLVHLLRACLGINGMKGNEGHWGGGISIISQNFPKSPSILFHPLIPKQDLIGINMTMILPNEIGRLTNLQLLEHVTFYISGNLLDQLKRLTNLKVLGLLLLWTQ